MNFGWISEDKVTVIEVYLSLTSLGMLYLFFPSTRSFLSFFLKQYLLKVLLIEKDRL